MLNYLKQLVGFDDGSEELTDAPFKIVDSVERLSTLFQNQSDRINAIRSPDSLFSWVEKRQFIETDEDENEDGLSFVDVLKKSLQ